MMIGLSVTHEISNMKMSQNQLSYISALVIAYLMGVFIMVLVYQWCKSSDPVKYEKQKYFKAMFGGYKDIFWCRSFPLLFLLRRLMFIILVITFEGLPTNIKIYMFVCIQATYYIFLIIKKPYQRVKDNIGTGIYLIISSYR